MGLLSPLVIARPWAGIHVSLRAGSQDVDGRDKPGHDDAEEAAPLWTFVICDTLG